MKENSRFYLRDIIGEYLCELGERDSRVVAVTADLAGTCRIQKFTVKFPERSFNVGIAEQNMVSFAAGLANEGFIPYVFSMAPFISMRACEQCRTDVAYENLNVCLIGTYAGFSGGISGATHWGLEDCAILGSMAGMTILEPCDPVQATRMMDTTLEFDGPVYMRSTVGAVMSVYDENYVYEVGKASVPIEGNDGAFICSGATVQYAIEAADIIHKRIHKNIMVVDMHTVKPIDKDAVIRAAETGYVVVAQDHNAIGGLGYHVAAVIAAEGLRTKLRICGAGDYFVPMAHADYLYRKCGYDTEGLVKAISDMLKKTKIMLS